MIDLRSDTVSQPSKEMLARMMSAPTGDDVFGEDPTVIELQERLADGFQQEAGLFCPSGTMTNQIAISVHTRPGDEVICDRLSHIYNYEGGGIARNSGCSVRLVHGDRGRFTAKDVAENINPSDSHYSRTRLVSIEDTVNKGGGAIYDFEEIRTLSEFCKKSALPFHLDGARVVNALVETGVSWKSYGEQFDSISICLSKGLGTPGGSVLLGSKDFIQEAHRTRKVMGGGMRQIGILAAAGLYALDHNVERLKEDHRRAKKLGEHLAELPWVERVENVDTNIVIFHLADQRLAQDCMDALKKEGILALPFGTHQMRFVSHLDFSENDLKKTLEILSKLKF